jgi:DNA-binding response OmpR family regulator
MTAVKPILLVDDDLALRQSLAEQLQMQGEFEAVEAADAAAALAMLPGRSFAAILLDIGLPDMDGRELCRSMRRQGITCPIILLAPGGGPTAPDDGAPEQHRCGASDTVTRPFRLGALLARLRDHVSRAGQAGDQRDASLAVGPYSFRPTAKELRDVQGDRRIRLTEKEVAILANLLHAAGRVVARAALLGEVWGYNAAVDTHTLETHVYRLRRKMERDPANAEILVTEAGGYRLAL